MMKKSNSGERKWWRKQNKGGMENKWYQSRREGQRVSEKKRERERLREKKIARNCILNHSFATILPQKSVV